MILVADASLFGGGATDGMTIDDHGDHSGAFITEDNSKSQFIAFLHDRLSFNLCKAAE